MVLLLVHGCLAGMKKKLTPNKHAATTEKRNGCLIFFLSVMFSRECVALAFLVGRGKWCQNFPRGKGGAHPLTAAAAASRNSMISSIFENATIDVN